MQQNKWMMFWTPSGKDFNLDGPITKWGIVIGPFIFYGVNIVWRIAKEIIGFAVIVIAVIILILVVQCMGSF